MEPKSLVIMIIGGSPAHPCAWIVALRVFNLFTLVLMACSVSLSCMNVIFFNICTTKLGKIMNGAYCVCVAPCICTSFRV